MMPTPPSRMLTGGTDGNPARFWFIGCTDKSQAAMPKKNKAVQTSFMGKRAFFMKCVKMRNYKILVLWVYQFRADVGHGLTSWGMVVSMMT
jgi:hypothetical protein